MRFAWVTFLLIILFGALSLNAQTKNGSTTKNANANMKRSLHKPDPIRFLWSDRGASDISQIPIQIQRSCKSVTYQYLEIVQDTNANAASKSVGGTSQPPLLKVTGNILYDVNYRSRIDTPYAENNVYQHTIQTHLDFLYKGQYPFRVYLTNSFGNSAYFRKYNDFTFLYNQGDFVRVLKSNLLSATRNYILSKNSELDSLKRLIDKSRSEIGELNKGLPTFNAMQRQVEEREAQLLIKKQKPGNADSLAPFKDVSAWYDKALKYKFAKFDSDSLRQKLHADSLQTKATIYLSKLNRQRQKLDSLLALLKKAEDAYRSLHSATNLNMSEVSRAIESSQNAEVLKGRMKELGMPDSLIPKGYKELFALKSLSLGRSAANYSDLTVNNISITGVQVEYNPKYYYAVAAGKVDYRFRDYITPSSYRSNQFVALFRFGKGDKYGNHIFLTYYTGRRQLFNSFVANQPGAPIPEYNLAGISLEASYRLNRNFIAKAEIAKSTIPYYSLDSTKASSWMSGIGQVKSRNNEAYAFSLTGFMPRTQTRLYGNVKYIGASFQSFSTFTTGASRVQWQAKIEQPFFRKKLNITGSLQQNDYNNPYAGANYSTSSLLASFQASLKIRKWPFVSIGYFPSYQLTKIGDNSFTESRYYTLVSNLGYYFSLGKAQLSSYLVYSKFYNQAVDSGFVYFNSSNLMFSQNAGIGRFSLAMNLSVNVSDGYSLYTVDNSAQVKLNSWLSIGGGAKWIRYSLLPQPLMGYSANASINIRVLGNIQFMMDNGFIPGPNKQLVENKFGRLTYYKSF